MKKIILPFMILMAAVMMSSCIILVDGEYGSYGSGSDSSTSTSVVTVSNCDPDRSSYISSVSYKKESGSWKTGWEYTNDYSDSSIKFSTGSSGYYYLKVTVVYKDYYGKGQDAYATFETEESSYISSYSTTKFTFNGSSVEKVW